MSTISLRTRRGIVSTALILGGLLVITGCATPTPDTQATPATPATSQSSPTEAPEQENPVADRVSDHLIPLEEVTDEYGTYTRLTIDPNSPLLTEPLLEEETAALIEYGFSQDDIDQAREFVTTYFVEQFLDSPQLDNYNRPWEEYLAETAPKYWSDDAIQEASQEGMNPASAGMLISQWLPTPINRDGTARGVHEVTFLGAEPFTTDAGLDSVNIGYEFISRYTTTEEAARQALSQNTGAPAEDLRDHFPTLWDGDGQAEFTVEGFIWLNWAPSTGKLQGAAGAWLPIEPETRWNYYGRDNDEPSYEGD